MRWFSLHLAVFVVGLALFAIGMYGIYQPLAAASVGAVLMAISALGSRGVPTK